MSIRVSSLSVGSAHASVPDAYAQCTYEPLLICSACFEEYSSILKFFTLMQSISIKNWCILSNRISSLRMLSVRKCSWCVCSLFSARIRSSCTHEIMTGMPSARMSSWCVCSAHAWVPYAHAQRTYQFLMRILRIQNEHMMRALSIRVRNW